MNHENSLNVRFLELAVIAVYDGNAATPGAEEHTLYAHPKAKRMVANVRKQYKKMSGSRCGIEAHIIADAYMKFRKKDKGQKQAARDDAQIPTEMVYMA